MFLAKRADNRLASPLRNETPTVCVMSVSIVALPGVSQTNNDKIKLTNVCIVGGGDLFPALMAKTMPTNFPSRYLIDLLLFSHLYTINLFCLTCL